MKMTYKARRFWRGFGITILVAVLVAAVAGLCWLLWLNRYVIYTGDGAKLDFGLSALIPEGKPAVKPDPKPTVDIYYNEGENVITPQTTELKQISAVWVTESMLVAGVDKVLAKIQTLPVTTAIILDVKNIRGEFFVPTDMGRLHTKIDIQALADMVETLHAKGYYLIARMPAFQDYYYFWDDGSKTPYGLPYAGGNGSLWLDQTNKTYWFNPSSKGTMEYLAVVFSMLRSLGFDEVLLTGMRIPETKDIVFEGDRVQAVMDAAAQLVKNCTTKTFAVSFEADGDFLLPQGRSRLYIPVESASDVDVLAEKTGLTDQPQRLVFVTALMDTRLDPFSVARPLA